MDDPYAQPVHEYLTDLDLEILNLLRNNTQGAELLGETLSQQREQISSGGVLSRLDEMTSRGLLRPSVSPRADARCHEPLAEGLEAWEITEEGCAVVESHSGVARVPYGRDVADDQHDQDRDVAGLVGPLIDRTRDGGVRSLHLAHGNRFSRWLEPANWTSENASSTSFSNAGASTPVQADSGEFLSWALRKIGWFMRVQDVANLRPALTREEALVRI